MAHSLQHQGSSCWLPFPVFSQRRPSRKLLADSSRRDKSEGSSADAFAGSLFAGNKVAESYVPQNSTEHDNLEKGARPAEMLILNGGNVKKTRSVIKALLSKTLFMKHYWKKKMLPLTPQLLRTSSNNHQESNNYTLQDEMSSDSETSQANCNEQGPYSFESRDNVPLLSRRRKSKVHRETQSVNHAGDHLTEKRKVQVDRLHDLITNDFERMIDIPHLQQELLAENLEGPKLISDNDSRGQHAPRAMRVLNKSDYLPVIDKTGRRSAQSSKYKQTVFASNHFVDQELTSSFQTKALNSTDISNGMQTVSSEVGERTDLLNPGNSYVSDGSPMSPKERLKELTSENKEYHHISKDAFMDKIPYGKNVAEELATPKMFRSYSARSHRDSTRENIDVSSRDNPYQGMQMSHSAIESMSRYSSLFESLSTKNSKSLQENLILKQDDQTETIHATSFLSEKPSPPYDEVQHVAHHSMEDELVGLHVEKHSSHFDDWETFDSDLHQSTSLNTIEQNAMCKFSDAAQDDFPDTDMPLKVNEMPRSDDMETDLKPNQLANVHAATCELEFELEVEQRDEPASSRYVLDMQHDSNLVWVENLSSTTDSKIKSEIFNDPDVNDSDGLKADVSILSSEHKSEGLPSSNDHLHTQVYQKEQVEFKYDKNFLLKSGSNDLGLFSELHRELGGHIDELEVGLYDYDDVPLEPQVFLDLMNEVTLELYEKSSAHGWMSRFASELRPITSGDHFLEEVLAKLSSQIAGQEHTSSSLQDVVAQGFAKNHEWSSLLMDAESVGTDVGSLILDQVLDELLPELMKS